MSEEAKTIAREVAREISQVLDERRSVPEQMHSDHHQFVGRLIQKDKKREALKQSLKQQVGGWSIITFITGIGYAVYKAAEGMFKP